LGKLKKNAMDQLDDTLLAARVAALHKLFSEPTQYRVQERRRQFRVHIDRI